MNIKIHNTEDCVPIPQPIDWECNDYYLVYRPGYGWCMAMFLENSLGEAEWYKDYTSKIIVNVSCWGELKTPKL